MKIWPCSLHKHRPQLMGTVHSRHRTLGPVPIRFDTGADVSAVPRVWLRELGLDHEDDRVGSWQGFWTYALTVEVPGLPPLRHVYVVSDNEYQFPLDLPYMLLGIPDMRTWQELTVSWAPTPGRFLVTP